MPCIKCGSDDDDLRMGFCFDCASAGEQTAAHRGVIQHIRRGLGHLRPRDWWKARIDFRWAWERLTRTGDYAPGGLFEHEYGIDSSAQRSAHV